jgi:uncharacterized protein YgiM (DUF1202 family)
MTTTDPLALCASALTPFEETILLDTSELPAAKYIVRANGIEASFKLLSKDISIFKQQLVDALNARDFELLRVMMHESLMISHWRSEGNKYEMEAAIEQLRLNYLNVTSSVIAEPQKNLIELLQDTDPISVLGTDVNGAATLFVSGLGTDGKAEAILYVAALPDGDLYWHGFLIAPSGFIQSAQPIDTTVYATNIQYVTAEKDLPIYSGPGSNFLVIENLFAGQVAVVTGKNLDESWWHVACENNSASDCWVSADNKLTRPSTVVQGFQPAPEPEKTPTITILAVTQNDQVTIRTKNFPADTKFSVRMGKIGTTGIDGILVENFNSKKGGSITAAFDIPKHRHGDKQIAIRLESQTGYYSYNWFDNVTVGNATPNPTDLQPTDVGYITIRNDVEIYSGPGVKYGVIGSLDGGQIVKVNGISADGRWWQITCPNGKGNSCWVSTKLKFTRPLE